MISSSLQRLGVRASYREETWQEKREDGDKRGKEHGKAKVLETRGED